MLLRLFELTTAAALALRGARRFRHEAGEVSMVVYGSGPPQGEPWVLLHGLGATTLGWRPVLRALDSDCQVLAPELSALGGTRGPSAGLDVRQGVAAVADLVRRRLPGRKVSIAGLSLGGWIATRLALEQPDLVERLVLISCAGYRDQDWERIRDLVTVRRAADVVRLQGALFHRVPWLVRAVRRGYLEAFRAPAVRQILQAIDPRDAFGDEDLERLKMPVALVWGAHDGLFSLDVGRRMHAAIPGAEIYVIGDGAHTLNWEHPRALVAAIQTFRGHAPASGAALE